jgi:hypothetical protein
VVVTYGLRVTLTGEDAFVVLALVGSAVIALLATLPFWRKLAAAAPWAFLVSLALAAILIDFRAALITGGPLRYLGTAVVLAAAAALRDGAPRGARWFYLIPGVLCIYAALGTIIGRVFLDTPDGAFPFALPLLIVLVGHLRDPGDSDLRFGLKVVSLLGSGFTVLAAAERLGKLSQATLAVYNHEKAFIGVLALGCAIAARSFWLMLIAVASSAWVFSLYPAATYAVAFASMLLTYALLRWSPGRTARSTLVVLGVPAVLWITLHLQVLLDWFDRYFLYVGKTDNSSARWGFYQLALNQIERHPWFADWFTGNLTIRTDLSGREGVILPVHNDYLGLALSGGLIATGLLILTFASLNGLALHAMPYCSRQRKRTIAALLAAMNAAAVTCFANPVFMNPASSTAVWTIAAAVASLSLGARRTPHPEAVDDLQRVHHSPAVQGRRAGGGHLARPTR